MHVTHKLVSFFKDLTVEPIILVLSFTVFGFSTATDNLFLQKICMPFEPNTTNTVCEDPDSISTSSGVTTLRTCLREPLCGVVVLLAGAWRDRTGLSKPLMILGMCGQILGVVVVMTGYVLWSTSPWIIGTVESLVIGLTGGLLLINMATNCYVVDNSTMENRMSKFSRNVAAVLLGGVISSASSGPLLSALGYKYFFIMIIMLHISSLSLIMILIKEKQTEKKEGSNLLSAATVKSVFKSGGNNAGIWMMIFASGFMNVVLTGEAGVSLYYLQQGFKFSVTYAGYYNCFRIAMPAISSIVLGPILTKVLKLDDFKISVISGLATISAAVAMVFARTLLHLILFSCLDIMKPFLISVIKSIMSKLLKPEESGVYFGFESVLVSILPSVFLPLYNWVFSSTLTTMPGAFYLISAGLEVGIILLFCGTYCLYGKLGSAAKELDIEAESKSQEEETRDKFDDSNDKPKDSEANVNSVHI